MIILKYWLTVLKSDNCILANVYKHLYNTSESCTNWATKVKILLDSLGLSYIYGISNTLIMSYTFYIR